MGLSDVAKKATKPANQTTSASDAPTATATAVMDTPPATSTALSIPAAGLMAVISAADAGQGLAFPTLTVTGGASGGMLAPHKSVPPEIANRMPQGKMPVDGVFIGLRTEVSAWSTGYDDRDPNAEQQPNWTLAAAAQDQETALLIQDACKQYQFTKKDNKNLFDFAKSAIGHIRPSLQIMCWSKTLGDVVVIQSPPAYESWVEGLRGMLRLADKDTGALAQFPMSLHINSLPRSSKSGQNWLVHVFSVDVAPNAQGVESMNAFKAWRAALPDEKVAEVNGWLAATDRPLTPNIREALVKAKGIRA